MWIERAIDLDFIIHYKRIPPPPKKSVFFWEISPMWVGGVVDSQTRSKPLKKTNHPENRLF